MSSEISTLEVFILDKSYRINCPESEQENLRSAAQYLDRKMREIRGGSKVIGLERVAVIAALNITHEMQTASRQVSSQSSNQDELAKLIAKLDSALEQH